MKSPSINKDRTAKLIEFARQVIDECRKAKIPLRLLGSVGVYYHCWDKIPETYEYRELKDVDFIFRSRNHLMSIIRIFVDHGFVSNRDVLINSEGRRAVLYKKDLQGDLSVDLIGNPFNYAQRIDFSNRFGLDPYCLSLSDLFLTKMQRVELQKKDTSDILLLLNNFGISESDEKTIATRVIAPVLSRSWGFYHCFMRNMYVLLSEGLDNRVGERIISEIEHYPKTASWKFRSLFGEWMRYYQPVESL